MRSVLLSCVALLTVAPPCLASYVSYTSEDTTTLGMWRTAAPDADSKYGTDGYVMFYYQTALTQGYAGKNAWTKSDDLAALPGYISDYSLTGYNSNGGSDGGTGGASSRPSIALQDPTTVTKLATAHDYGYAPEGGAASAGNLTATLTMAADKTFKLGLYAGHEDSNLGWQDSYTVSVGGSSATSNLVVENAGVWEVFSIDAKAGDVVTITANCQAVKAGSMISAMTFDGTVPEPGTIVLAATGLLGLVAYAWRKRR